MSFQAKKFQDLIETVEQLHDNKFDLYYWKHVSFSCGTVCCAGGAYAMRFPMRPKLKQIDGRWMIVHPATNNKAITALVEEFEISENEAEAMFMGCSYPPEKQSKKDVLNRLKQFYKDKLSLQDVKDNL